MQFDVFNGDADGICALIQLRLDQPVSDATLITGVKRDISLVNQVDGNQATSVLVLDISLDKNRDATDELISRGIPVSYYDHHYPGENLPESELFNCYIDTQATICTSLIVNQQLAGKYTNWAITAAFGDNLLSVATDMANAEGLSKTETENLKLLGTCINYNGYGSTVNDLHFTPDTLFKAFQSYSNPLDIINEANPVWLALLAGYTEDLNLAQSATQQQFDSHCLMVMLPNETWARRVSGILGNQLANDFPDMAIAVLTTLATESATVIGADIRNEIRSEIASESDTPDYLVSLRAPINNREGADEVARKFETGGGRKAAAGINKLSFQDLERLKKEMIYRWSV